MTQIHETAYPRMRTKVTKRELNEIYTPTKEEMIFVDKHTRTPIPRFYFIIRLKIFQRLGYFPAFDEIPSIIINHIAQIVGIDDSTKKDINHKTYKVYRKYASLIRQYLGIKSYSDGGIDIAKEALLAASNTKDIVADIINAGIEELVRQCYELPAFTTIRRAAYDARATTNKFFYKQIFQALNPRDKEVITSLLTISEDSSKSSWNRLKQEPKPPTSKNMREFLKYLKWLQSLKINESTLKDIPELKLKRFSDEANAFDISRMNELVEDKRMTYAAALITDKIARALDDLADMFIRSVQNMHNKGKEALDEYRNNHQDRTDALIERLHKIASAWKKEKGPKNRHKKIKRIFGKDVSLIIEQCNEHLIYINNNAIPFYLLSYKTKRRNFFRFIETVQVCSTTSDTTLEKVIAFLLRHKKSIKPRLTVGKIQQENYKKLLDLSWIPDKWWKLVTGSHRRDAKVLTVNRRYFEICVFSSVRRALKSGDLFIIGSKVYNDYRKELISWEDYDKHIDLFCEQINLSKDAQTFVNDLQAKLNQKIQDVDSGFPTNEAFSIKKGKFTLKKVKKRPEPEGYEMIDKLITERTPLINILDVFTDTEHWLNWTSKFGPRSGLEGKLDNDTKRYIATTFCYGCFLGPTQTSQSLKEFDRWKISYVNQHHVDEEKIQSIIVDLINQYNKFDIIKCWDSGQKESASADGTKWDIYEQNLLSEYHIRYGGWGGVGYYHVSSTYIALFSKFIPCGVWEGIHILDIFKNQSDIKPKILYGDTQAQSEILFGLAYLLGIKLMPRIRKWKGLNFYLHDSKLKLNHIGELFTDIPIDWNNIEVHLKDMLRIALSISKGRISPSTILRRLGSYCHRNNKLYVAFRELGRVVRTIFLLDYISDLELRRVINSATNISEAWNGFVQWVGFGHNGKVPGNSREEQMKSIKYNHLVANLIVFHNTVTLTNIIKELKDEGYHITDEIIAMFSPYRGGHINRFGTYEMRLERKPLPLPIG